MARLIVRADSSYAIGSGHIKRCITLAKEFSKKGWEVHFISTDLEGNFTQLVEAQGFYLHDLHQEYPEGEQAVLDDAKASLDLINKINPTIVLVDHYSLGIKWENFISSNNYKLVVIDDFKDREHRCDFLINQNFFKDIHTYKKALEDQSIKPLLGPEYSLIDVSFLAARENIRKYPNKLENIFIFFGGVDPDNVTTRVLRVLEREEFKSYHFEIVIGENNLNKNEIFDLIKSKTNVTIHIQLENLAEVIARCDLAICAGGSNTWERACLGLPSVVITLAKNQYTFTQDLFNSGYIEYIGDFNEISEEDIFTTTLSLINDRERRLKMKRLCLGMVDGLGAQRVANILTDKVSSDVSISKTPDDIKERLKITIVSDEDSWLNEDISGFIYYLNSVGQDVKWIHKVCEIQPSDVCFILSFTTIIPQEILSKNKNNIVVHESDLPQGKGISPMTWQILDNKTEIIVSLFEAEEGVDSGPIYYQNKIFLTGHELIKDWRALQARMTFDLCLNFLINYPEIIAKSKTQKGKETFYKKRFPKDSKLNINKSLEELFPLFRVADNNRYPVFFERGDYTYILKIEKVTKEE